jgi:hypothetical protein
MRQKNMVMGPAEPATKNNCAGADNQEFIWNHLFPKLLHSHCIGVIIKELPLIF